MLEDKNNMTTLETIFLTQRFQIWPEFTSVHPANIKASFETR